MLRQIWLQPAETNVWERETRQAVQLAGEKWEMLSPELFDIITEQYQVFAVEDSELTQTSSVAHDILTGDSKPSRHKTRPVPNRACDELKIF
ncbi:unnamed protein product [Haemonchus placei]|uniref:HMG box domain-containing protein n=1 Tax=Haemonchus placei TaxID=6290 RepID=A0A0N4WI49_HAEPC|nr:unnamed protein product [Haemonchus placei]